jgi:hypothetical protein
MSPVNRKLAAGATVVALGGLTAVAIGQPGHTDTKKQVAAPVEVRTETIQKTVRIVRHEKPRHRRVPRPAPVVAPRPASAASPPAPGASAATGSAPTYSAPAPRPITPRYTGGSTPSGTGTSTHQPVTTRTSGGGSGGGNAGGGEGERDDKHEGEGGDD